MISTKYVQVMDMILNGNSNERTVRSSHHHTSHPISSCLTVLKPKGQPTLACTQHLLHSFVRSVCKMHHPPNLQHIYYDRRIVLVLLLCCTSYKSVSTCWYYLCMYSSSTSYDLFLLCTRVPVLFLAGIWYFCLHLQQQYVLLYCCSPRVLTLQLEKTKRPQQQHQKSKRIT